jgi:hypothetical protein
VHFADTENHESSDINKTTSSERNSAGEIIDEVEEDNYVANFIRRISEAIISSQVGTYDNKPGIIRMQRTMVMNELIQNFVLHNSRCQVLCGSRKKLPRTSLQCCYIFWSFGIIDASTIKC